MTQIVQQLSIQDTKSRVQNNCNKNAFFHLKNM